MIYSKEQTFLNELNVLVQKNYAKYLTIPSVSVTFSTADQNAYLPSKKHTLIDTKNSANITTESTSIQPYAKYSS